MFARDSLRQITILSTEHSGLHFSKSKEFDLFALITYKLQNRIMFVWPSFA